MALRLKKVRRGEKVTAIAYNALVDAITALQSRRFGKGFRFRDSAFGGVIDLDSATNEDLIPARITGAPTSSPISEDECRYTVRSIDNPEWVLDGIKPSYNRPLRGADVKMNPGKVGDFCYIVRAWAGGGKYESDAWILTESYVVAKCNPSPGALRNPLLDSVIPVPPSTTNSTPASAGDDGAVPAGE